MANIKFRLARKEDIMKLIEISNHPSNLAEGSVPWYLLAGRHQSPDTVSAAWEETIVDFIYSTSGWYTCVVAEAEDTEEVVGYCAWEWFDYDEKGKKVVEEHRPTKLQAIWNELGAEEPTHIPPRTYSAMDLQDGLLRARWEMSGLSDKHEEAHEALFTTAGSTRFSQFWRLHHLAIDPRPEHQSLMERLVKCGLKIAEKRGLWVVVACHEEKKPFYEKLGFRYRGDYTASVPGDDRELNLAWLQKDPNKRA